MKPTLVDTSFIVALLDKDERAHIRCRNIIDSITTPLITCEAVIAETCYLVREIDGASDSIVGNVANGTLVIAFDLADSYSRVRELMRKYRSIPMDFADACLVCMAEEFSTPNILTLDSDFNFYRWNKSKTFKNLLE